MFRTFNLIPLVFTLFTGLGVVVHDTQIDHATTNAISAVSASTVAIAVAGGSISNLPDLRLSDQHIHTEEVSITQALRNMSGLEPQLQTRVSEDKKYISPKKLLFQTSSS